MQTRMMASGIDLMACVSLGFPERPEQKACLNCGGAQHHVQAQRADRRHVGAHDVIARLGHDGHLPRGGPRVEADTQEAHPDLVRQRLDLEEKWQLEMVARRCQGKVAALG